MLRQFCLDNNLPMHTRENTDFLRQLLSAKANFEGCREVSALCVHYIEVLLWEFDCHFIHSWEKCLLLRGVRYEVSLYLLPSELCVESQWRGDRKQCFGNICCLAVLELLVGEEGGGEQKVLFRAGWNCIIFQVGF